jgi:serine phosphatase RsbU (regulator of sigma subunit)/putative methionine-R-sulfoxide reductase with GAF domain
MSPSAIGEARHVLERGIADVGAASATFYVRDPWWTDEFRLMALPGVRITEPMHGFLFPAGSRIATGAEEDFIADAPGTPWLREAMSPALRARAEADPLFGDFVAREGVASCARFRHVVGDRVDAVLFINFNEPADFDAPLKERLRALWRRLVGQVAEIIDEVARVQRFPGAKLVRILKPTQQLAGFDTHDPGLLLETVFGAILDAAFEALAVAPGEGLGTIHLFDAEARTLRLAAHRGHVDAPFPVQSVDQVEGILSWVALKRRSIVIDDLERSNYRALHIPVREDIRSELAVPMMAGGDLLGVLNLESTRPAWFSAEDARAIAYAANQAAIACRLHRQVRENRELADRTERLLYVCHRATTGLGGAELSGTGGEAGVLDELATVGRDFLRAARCDIWQYDRRRRRFTDAGASYTEFRQGAGPRPDGLSHYVLRTRVPVWVADIQDRGSYGLHFWDAEGQRWDTSPPADGAPALLNDRLIAMRVCCTLGLPVEVGDRCNGVAWLKYDSPRAPVPSPGTMRLARGFAAEAGLVLDSVQHHKELIQQKADEAVREGIRRSLFATGRVALPGLDGCLLSRPAESGIGGDFHDATALDDHTVGVLIGDAESHGITGALYMLPLITTFRVFNRDSRSTKHILGKLHNIAYDLSVRATALYFIIGTIGERRWLFASSAGHHPLLIFRGGEAFEFPRLDRPAHGLMLGCERDLIMGEDGLPLSPGDVIVGYTDGVVEAGANQGAGREPFGTAGLEAAVRPLLGHDAETIGRAIESRLEQFADGPIADDVTIVVIRVP